MDSAPFRQSNTTSTEPISSTPASEQGTTKQQGIVALLKKPLTLRISGSTRIVCFSQRHNDDTSHSESP